MATTSKHFFITLLIALMMSSMGNARQLANPRASLASRIKVDDGSANCWDSLMQIQACTGEIILFFLNGEMHLGDGCCQAIRTIREQCWPNMIDTLGFTAEEGDILEGYCHHKEENAKVVHTPPSPFSVAPNSEFIINAMKSMVP